MRLQLRKIHHVVWSILAVVLPLLLIAGAMSITPRVKNDTALGSTASPIGSVVKELKSDPFIFRLRSEGAKRQLEIQVTNSIARPSVYVLAKGDGAPDLRDDEVKPLGKLGPPGVYRFTLPDHAESWDRLYITMADMVKKEIILQTEIEQ